MSESDFTRGNTKLMNAMFFAPKLYGSIIHNGGILIKYSHNGEERELHGYDDSGTIAKLSNCTELGAIMSWAQMNLYGIVMPNATEPQINHLFYNKLDDKVFVSTAYVTPNGSKVKIFQSKADTEMEFSHFKQNFTLTIRKQELELDFTPQGKGKFLMKVYEPHFAGFLDVIKAGDKDSFNAMLAKAVTINAGNGQAMPYDNGKALRRFMADEVPQVYGVRLFELAHEAAKQFTGCERALGVSKY